MKKALLIATALMGLGVGTSMGTTQRVVFGTEEVKVVQNRRKRIGGGGNGGQVKCFSKKRMNLSSSELSKLASLHGRSKKLYVKELKAWHGKVSRTEELLNEIKFENRKRA